MPEINEQLIAILIGVSVVTFVGTMIARSNADLGLDAQLVKIAIINDRVPWSRGVELPTPPPRA